MLNSPRQPRRESELSKIGKAPIGLSSYSGALGILISSRQLGSRTVMEHWGTGFAISANIVVTCSHNICQQGEQNKLEFIPGISKYHPNLHHTYKTYRMRKFLSGRLEHTDPSAPHQNEVALIQLDQRLEAAKYFKIKTVSIDAEEVCLFGFPAHQEVPLANCTIIKGQLVGILDDIIFYRCKTGVGFSGSPIVQQDYEEGGDAWVVGIHTHCIEGGQSGGVAITAKIYELIEGFKRQLSKIQLPVHQESIDIREENEDYIDEQLQCYEEYDIYQSFE